MPFDLHVSRTTPYPELRASASKPGFLARLIGKTPPPPPAEDPNPISLDDLAKTMEGAPCTRRDDSTWWVRYPDGDPWFVTRWDQGNVVLSASYSNHRFLRNFADMFDQGLRIAGALGARLFEEVRRTEVTSSNIDALLDPDGDYVALQAQTFKSTLQMLDAEVRAPLEYPLGPIDVVSELLVFHVQPERTIGSANVVELVDAMESCVREPGRDDALYVVGKTDQKRLAKILHRPDGRWQVWPAHGHAAFSRIAPAVVLTAEAIHAQTGGALAFRGSAYEDATRKTVHELMSGLSVDFHLWTQRNKA